MSTRDRTERPSGANARPATRQPRPAEPGAGSPTGSGRSERGPASPSGPRARPPVPDPKGRALRLVLVSRDKMLAGALRSLVEAPGGVRVLDWHSDELDAAIRHADVVIVDMPPRLHERTFAVIDGRFLGRTVVLLQEGEHAEALPPGPPRTVLYRPVQIGELWMAVTGGTPRVTVEAPAAAPEQTPDSAPEPVDAESGPSPRPQDPEPPADEAPAHEEASGEAPAVAADGPGLPVAKSGRLIGLSGRELDPVVGPGQVAPGMDEATLERLRGWRGRGRQPAAAGAGPARGTHGTTADREQARRAKAAQAEARQAARSQAERKRAARAQARAAAREEARQAKAAKSEAERAAREARAEQARQAQAEREEARAAARAEARRAKAARAEARAAARLESKQARAARAEARAAARAEARQAKAAEAKARRAERAEARRAARAEAKQAKAAATEARREQSRQARAARKQERAEARAARVADRKAARDEAREARAAQAEEGKVAWAGARQPAVAGAGAAGRGWAAVQGWAAGRGWAAARRWMAAVAVPALLILAVVAIALAAAGWRADGGPDTLAGEVAAVRAAGGPDGGLVVQDPRLGPIEPLHALAVGAWLRVTEAGGSLEGAIREARVPSRFLLAGVVVLSVLLLLLLMRVGPGAGAAAGPGPAPPHIQRGPGRWWRLGAAALAGVLVALDPALVRSGRAATGTVLAVALALGALALAWGLPPRPVLRWLPLVAAVGGLALLVSPLALPVLAVPVVAELLQGRHREAWRDMAALGLGIGLWLALPVWVAGQGLDAGRAWSLLDPPPARGALPASLADAPLTWLLVAAGLAAAVLPWRHRSGARAETGPAAARLAAWTATTAAGALVAVVLGYPAAQALPFAVPAAAVALAAAGTRAASAAGGRPATRRLALAGIGVALAGLLVAQGVDWGASYRPAADDGLARLVASVQARVPGCSAVNAGGPDDRARLLAAGATVTEFSDGPAAHAAGVRYFVLTGATAEGGPQTPALAAWVRQHGTRLAVHPSRSLSGLELWRVDAAPLDPVADSVPVPGGVFSNVDGSACGGYRVVDGPAGAFYSAYRAVGGKAVLGRPLGSVWTSDGPALQAFDTMVLGAVPASSGPPAVAPVELPPLLAKLNVEAVADANIPLPSARPPVTVRQTRALLRDNLIARAYLGTDPGTASPADWRRARARFGRPLGLPQVMPDGAVRQTFERVVLELPADGGPARPAALGHLAVRLGLVPKPAMRLEPVPGLSARPAATRLDTGPLLRLVGGALLVLALAAGAGAVTARRSRTTHTG